AMSNLPSMRPVSWKDELGVGVILIATPLSAKKPLSAATQIGQLKPPGKTITSSVLLGAAAALKLPVNSNTAATKPRMNVIMFVSVLECARDGPNALCARARSLKYG